MNSLFRKSCFAVNDPKPKYTIRRKSKLEFLENGELGNALGAGLRKGKADLLVMMNCNTMNLHSI